MTPWPRQKQLPIPGLVHVCAKRLRGSTTYQGLVTTAFGLEEPSFRSAAIHRTTGWTTVWPVYCDQMPTMRDGFCFGKGLRAW